MPSARAAGAHLQKFCASFFAFVLLSVQVIFRRTQRAKNPMAYWFQELDTDGIAVVAQALAISDAGLGAKIARKRFERQMVVAIPAAEGKDAGAAGADVFGESGFDSGNVMVTRDMYGNGHGNSLFKTRNSKVFLHALPQ